MNKNVFLKSILRQQLRSLLLFALIGIAAFAFVLRAVEYIVIQRHINEVGRNYRAVGFLRAQGNTENIYQGAQILSESRFMGFEDRRRRFEGILQDSFSPDVAGMPQHIPPEDVRLYSAVYFYGRVDQIYWGHVEEHGQAWIVVYVTEVVAGPPHHITQGWQAMYFNVDSPPADDMSFVDEKEEGETYLFKGHFYRTAGMPSPGSWHDNLVIQPIPSPEQMQAEIERINRDSRTITLQTTRDMALLADVQGRSSPMGLLRGRVLNYNDYVNANPVAVIHIMYAHLFWLDIGDSLTVRVYHNQFVHSTQPSTWTMGEVGLIDSRNELIIASTPDDSGYTEIELEIVGIYNSSFRTDNTHGFGVIYVPDSIIPSDIYVEMPEENYLPALWYSFVLNNTRQEQAFFTEYRERLEPYGITLHMFRSGAEVFWAAADSILLMTAFNAFVFSFVVLLVLALVSYVFVKQRRKEFAIARSLGISVRKILLQICLSFFIIGFPAAAIGSGAAWFFAMEEATQVLEPFAENFSPLSPMNLLRVDIVGEAIFEAAQPEFSYWIMVFLMSGFFLFILVMILLSVFTHIRRPVLEQLQGQSAVNTGRGAKAHFDEAVPDYDGNASTVGLTAFDAKPQSGARFASALGWIFAHIVRSPGKTILTVGVTLIFIIALGWLQESISRTEDNIDYLYDNTVVHVELDNRGGQFTAYERLGMIYNSGYFDIFSPEASHNLAFILPSPENWQEQIGFDSTIRIQYNIWMGVFDIVIGISDIDDFIAEHSRIMIGDEVLGLQMEFIQDFDKEGFVYDDDTLTQVIPVILSQHAAERWDMAIGDMVYFGYTRVAMALANWYIVPAKVVGIHNQHIHLHGFEHGAIVPVGVIENMLGPMTQYHALRLTLDSAFNREIDDARYTLEHYMVHHRGALARMFPMDVLFFDEELRNMVGAMSQILVLLELLYPVALVLAIVIGTAVFALLMLQAAQNAAIMRVLGASKFRTCVTMCTEQFIVCMSGLILGLGALLLLSWGAGFVALFAVAGIYLAGAMAGSIVGALIITAKAPIDLLQVRE